jgi:two-component system chemotaxis response regulator CheB
VALRELLGNLSPNFPAAVIIVQHMPATFTGVLAAQLDRQVPFKVKEAQAGDRLQPGLALVAPGDYHLLLRPDSRVELNQGPEIGGHRPSIDVTMQSVAQLYGARTKGVVLTGMGNDGSLGLAAIHAKGGKTFAQDADSCVVDGMPQRAIEKGVVDHVAPPTNIAQLLRAI